MYSCARSFSLFPYTTLFRSLDSHVAVQHRLERLAAEYDITCRELEDVRSQLAAAGEKNFAAQQELEHQTEALLHREQERSEEHTSELQSRGQLVCRLLLEKK